MGKRIERKGLRPRDAAYLIGAFWAIAVVVFGVLERIVDPQDVPQRVDRNVVAHRNRDDRRLR